MLKICVNNKLKKLGFSNVPSTMACIPSWCCNCVIRRKNVRPLDFWCLVVCLLCSLVQRANLEASTQFEVHGEAGKDVNSICEMTGCNCTTAFNYWQIVNCSFDNKHVDLRPGILSPNVIELSITGGKELKLHANLFSALPNFQRLRTDGTQAVIIKKHAFLNVTVNSLLVQLAACNSLILETAAFKNMKVYLIAYLVPSAPELLIHLISGPQGPVTAEVSRCGSVVIQRAVFSFLQDAIFNDIRRLDLEEEAFTLPARELGHHGAVTTIRFRGVMMPILPKDVFKSSLAEVSFVGSEVRDVATGAFSGNTIAAVIIRNTSLHRVRSGAFSDRTQLDNLFINDSQIHEMESDALLSATTNLTIQHSKIKKIQTGAINATIAKVFMHANTINDFQSHGFAIHDWSSITIDHNTFQHLHPNSMDVPFKFSPFLDALEFNFNHNSLELVETNALAFFSDISPNMSNSHFENNQFEYTCHCEIEHWLQEVLGSNCAQFSAYNFCTIDSIVAKCYDVPEGKIRMRNFTDTFCDNGAVIKCKVFDVDANAVNRKFSADPDESHLILGLILGLVFLVAVIGTAIILLIHGGIWLKRKGLCVRFNTLNYRTDEPSTDAEDIMVTVEKVETIPEELTQDLLQTLREKLEDPMTYNEAREMIEKLYDHFIIEDSYTNNNRQEEELHLYEELGNVPVEDKNLPTRPFSFLRLIEERFNFVQPEAVPVSLVLASEYSEPTDAEVHLYSELPQNGLKEGQQNEINESLSNRSTGSSRMAYRPLPDKPDRTDPGEGPSTKF